MSIRKQRLEAAQAQRSVSVSILPSGWKPWHPIVFGLLAGIGFRLVDPVMDFVLGIVRQAG